jgi:hypothetical protein
MQQLSFNTKAFFTGMIHRKVSREKSFAILFVLLSSMACKRVAAQQMYASNAGYSGCNNSILPGINKAVSMYDGPFTTSGVFSDLEENTQTNVIASFRANLFLLNSDNSTKLADGVLAQFDENFSDSVLLEDAVKFTNINENIAFLRHGISLTAERRPLITPSDTMFLKLSKTTQRSYQFEFQPANMANNNLTGYLQDSYLKTEIKISLSDTTTVNFSINGDAASAATDRFRIVFKPLLPFSFTLITAYQKYNSIPVEWSVIHETNIIKYDVEKSLNGTQFTNAGTTQVAGSNNDVNNYSWVDKSAVGGDNFYRIKMYSGTGEIKYSEVVRVSLGTKSGGLSVYPNPVRNNTISVQMNNSPAGKYSFCLTNAFGQVFYSGTLQLTGGFNKNDIKLTSKLSPQVYYLLLNGPDNKTSVQKIIVE